MDTPVLQLTSTDEALSVLISAPYTLTINYTDGTSEEVTINADGTVTYTE